MVEVATPVPHVPVAEEPVSEVGQMSQWALMRLRFTRNRLAMFGLIGLVVMYIVVFLGPFLAPNDYMEQNSNYVFGPPSQFTLIGPKGQFGLFIYSMTVSY